MIMMNINIRTIFDFLNISFRIFILLTHLRLQLSQLISQNRQMQLRENLNKYKISYSSQFLIIQSQDGYNKTQILINKRTMQIVYQSKAIITDLETQTKKFEFQHDFKVKHVSLILGLITVQDQQILVYADQVFQQEPLPNGEKIYQIASIDFLPFSARVQSKHSAILDAIKKEVFSFGFYFSFQTNLTLNQQQKTNPKIHHDDRFFWNKGMLSALIQNKTSDQWIVPVVQGHYSTFEATINGENIKYHLISRRSKFRSGARFYSRGINENGNCANFIETQQILTVKNKKISTVFISASSPVFWQQKSLGSSFRLTRGKQLTKISFKKHYDFLNTRYGSVMSVNLLQKKKQGQSVLIQAYEEIFNQFSQQQLFPQNNKYFFFDINASIKKGSFLQIKEQISLMQPIIECFGSFKQDMLIKNTLNRQKGVFKVTCLDCLARTNRFMRCLALKSFTINLIDCRIIGPKSEQKQSLAIQDLLGTCEKSLIKKFRDCWNDKADYQSMIVTGTRAATGHRNNFLDQISKSLISITRLYNQRFNDKLKQSAYNVILNNLDLKAQSNYMKHTSPFNVSIVTWNTNATNPQKLEDTDKILQKCIGSDLIVFGIQEMVDLNAGNNINIEDQSKMANNWVKRIQKGLSGNDKNINYLAIQHIEMVGLFLVIFISDKWKSTLKDLHKDIVKTGFGGKTGNKGGITIRINIFQTSLNFSCAHLAAGQEKIKQRIDDMMEIHRKTFRQNKQSVKNEVQIEFSDYKFFFGDLNFRLDGDFKQLIKSFEKSKQLTKQEKETLINQCLKIDQLNKLRQAPQTPYILASYNENPINFLPTYKLDKTNGQYTLQKSRNPSWCDRILYWCQEQTNSCQCLQYTSIDAVGSDHRPVYGNFLVNVVREQRKKSMDILNTPIGKQFRDSYFEGQENDQK